MRTPLLATVLLLAMLCTASADDPTAAEDVRPLLVGATVPDTALRSADGSATSLHEALGAGPAMVVFYRGGW